MADLISVADAAQLLGVHVQTVRVYIHGGRLKAFRVTGRGNRLLIEREDLDKLTEPVEVGAAPELVVKKKKRRN